MRLKEIRKSKGISQLRMAMDLNTNQNKTQAHHSIIEGNACIFRELLIKHFLLYSTNPKPNQPSHHLLFIYFVLTVNKNILAPP